MWQNVVNKIQFAFPTCHNTNEFAFLEETCMLDY